MRSSNRVSWVSGQTPNSFATAQTTLSSSRAPVFLGMARGTAACNQYPRLAQWLFLQRKQPRVGLPVQLALLALCQCLSTFFSRDPDYVLAEKSRAHLPQSHDLQDTNRVKPVRPTFLVHLRPGVNKLRTPNHRTTKFCRVAPNTGGFLARSLIHVALVAPRILRRRLVVLKSL